MNPHDKELSAALAYNRFMERRVLQLEADLRDTPDRRGGPPTTHHRPLISASNVHHPPIQTPMDRIGPAIKGITPFHQTQYSSPPPTSHPNYPSHVASNLASTYSRPIHSWSEPEVRGRTGDSRHMDPQADIATSIHRAASGLSVGSTPVAANVPFGRVQLEAPVVPYVPPSSGTDTSMFDGIGGVDALVEELLRLRLEQERLMQELAEKGEQVRTLEDEARQATLREGQASVRIQDLLQELAEIRELLPEKLFGEKKEDDRRIKDILMVARQVQQQDARYTRGSSLAVAHHMLGEVETYRTPQRTLRAMERANQPSSDPNWRFLGAVSHMSEMGAAREQCIFEDAQSTMDSILVSIRAFDETVSLYNVTGRHSVAVIVEAQGAAGEECMVVRRKADTFLSSMEALRVSRQESVLSAASGFPTLAILMRRLNNALLGASVRRVMKFAPSLMSRLEDLANAVEHYDVKAAVSDGGIPVSPAEQALRLHSTRPPLDEDERALSVQLWSASAHEVDPLRLEASEFRRIEVQDIKELASQNVSVDPSSGKVATFLDQVKELLTKVHHVIQGTDDEDGVGNQSNSKSVQCTLLGIRRQTTDAEDQYERLLHSFLQARSIERDAHLQLRRNVTERDGDSKQCDDRRPWNFHTPGTPKGGRFEPLDSSALDAKIKELADARLLARRERVRGGLGPAAQQCKRDKPDDQFEKELDAQLANIS